MQKILTQVAINSIILLSTFCCLITQGQTIPKNAMIFKLDRDNNILDFELRIKPNYPHKGKIEACLWILKDNYGYSYGVGYLPSHDPILVKISDLDSVNWITPDYYDEVAIQFVDGIQDKYLMLWSKARKLGAYVMEESLCDYQYCLLYPAHKITNWNVDK